MITVACPIIFFCVWAFVGMITILNKKIMELWNQNI